MAESKKVASFADYQTAQKPYEVSLTFSDEAGRSMRELMTRLGTDDPNDVALRAIGLLVTACAEGKEILFRDPKSGAEDAVDI